jgi:hypothetical protein
MGNFRAIARKSGCVLPPSVDEWLPEKHLARFIGEVIDDLDGTKIHANASRHSALSYEHAGKIEAQLKAEVADLMAKAEAAHKADIPDGMSIPDELARRGAAT